MEEARRNEIAYLVLKNQGAVINKKDIERLSKEINVPAEELLTFARNLISELTKAFNSRVRVIKE